jgi:hypothetical protein
MLAGAVQNGMVMKMGERKIKQSKTKQNKTKQSKQTNNNEKQKANQWRRSHEQKHVCCLFEKQCTTHSAIGQSGSIGLLLRKQNVQN